MEKDPKKKYTYVCVCVCVCVSVCVCMASLMAQMVQNPPAMAGGLGSIPEL